jgi:hypothetical protein
MDGQSLYLAMVLGAVTVFVVTLASVHIYVNLPDRRR